LFDSVENAFPIPYPLNLVSLCTPPFEFIKKKKTSSFLTDIQQKINHEGPLALPQFFLLWTEYLSTQRGECVSMSSRVLIPFILNAGLMKPRRGFTLVAAKEKLGVGKGGPALSFNEDALGQRD